MSYTERERGRYERWMFYLHVERKSVLLEGVEIKNQLLSTFGHRRQVTVAIHVDWLALEDLQQTR